jgi:orotidine-5'-phosphate decarboxylase
MEAAKNRLVVALDVETADRAIELVHQLRDCVGMFKIGAQLFTAAGPSIVRRIIDDGGAVFLDLKYHDIPNTVAAAGVEAARLGVAMFNMHALGGSEMMRRSADAVTNVSQRERLRRPLMLAVTILTSANAATMGEIGLPRTPAEQVTKLAMLAEASGMDGVVASPEEVQLIRSSVNRKDFVVVTPGVRPSGAARHDQKRVMTPAEALRGGSDYVVIGRPIIEAPDPVMAAREIAQGIISHDVK